MIQIHNVYRKGVYIYTVDQNLDQVKSEKVKKMELHEGDCNSHINKEVTGVCLVTF